MRRTKEDAEKTRLKIIEAALILFSRNGYSNTTLAMIGTEAGFSRGPIYWHFKNKHDIFVAMTERHRLPMESLSQQAESPDETDPLGKLRELLVYVLHDTVRDPCRKRVFEIIFHKCEFTAQTDPLMARQQETYLDGSDKIRRTLNNAIAQGQLPDTLNIERAITMLHVQMTGMLYTWLLIPDSFDLEAEAEHFVDCYLGSLRECPSLSGQ